jgi:hypothetical protein
MPYYFSTPYPRLRGILNAARLLNSDKIIYNDGNPIVPLCVWAISAAGVILRAVEICATGLLSRNLYKNQLLSLFDVTVLQQPSAQQRQGFHAVTLCNRTVTVFECKSILGLPTQQKNLKELLW